LKRWRMASGGLEGRFERAAAESFQELVGGLFLFSFCIYVCVVREGIFLLGGMMGDFTYGDDRTIELWVHFLHGEDIGRLFFFSCLDLATWSWTRSLFSFVSFFSPARQERSGFDPDDDGWENLDFFPFYLFVILFLLLAPFPFSLSHRRYQLLSCLYTCSVRDQFFLALLLCVCVYEILDLGSGFLKNHYYASSDNLSGSSVLYCQSASMGHGPTMGWYHEVAYWGGLVKVVGKAIRTCRYGVDPMHAITPASYVTRDWTSIV
jgi:hypothetical protein